MSELKKSSEKKKTIINPQAFSGGIKSFIASSYGDSQTVKAND